MKTTASVRELAGGLEDIARWLVRAVPAELSYSSYTTLSRLLREGPLRVSDLAAREGMTQPGITVLVNRLADGGYAERVADPTDRRATLVRVTRAGEELMAERARARADVLATRLRDLDDDDRAALLAALPALRKVAAGSAMGDGGRR